MAKGRGNQGGSTRNKTKKKVDVGRAVQDKTFGMKNKKGKKAQEVRKQVRNSVASKQEPKREKKLTKKQQRELDAERMASVLGFNPHQDRKEKQEKKKKAAMPDLFIDLRSQRKNSKFVDDVNIKTCDHYKLAAEESKLGWFWACPNGGDCGYRHAFPEGYVLEKKKKDKEEVDARSLEQIIEDKRQDVNRDGPKVTLETFLVWKEQKRKEEASQKDEEERQRKKKIKQGKAKLTGRDIFSKSGYVEEEDGEDGEEFDLMAMRREKKQEEEMYDMEAAAKANSDLTVVFNKGEKMTVMALGTEFSIDPTLYILDDSVPSASEL